MKLSKFILVLLTSLFIQQISGQTDDSKTPSQQLYQSLEEVEKNPMILINGIVSDKIGFNNLNPEDISTFEVLKDDQAIKKYGENAKNGVIIVTLKPNSESLKKISSAQKKHSKNEKRVTLTGIVCDTNHIPISGAVISNLNEKEAFYSDINGEYRLTAYLKDRLTYSHTGFDTQEIIVNKKRLNDIILKEKPTNTTAIQFAKQPGKITIKKPVIYLYPTQKTDITIDLNFEGKLLTTFPKYEKNWTVTACPDGRIFDTKTNRFYSSLFWDGTQDFDEEHYRYSSGFVVVKENLADFLIKKLEFIGLNTTETNEFVQYWLPILEKNETNFIHFYANADYDVISKNTVFPKPDTEIRVFMEFYGLEKAIKVPEQRLSRTERKGFTLIEWGGSDVSEAIKELKKIKI